MSTTVVPARPTLTSGRFLLIGSSAMCKDAFCDGGCGCADRPEPEEMRRMAATLGVDRLLSGAERTEAAARCAECREREACGDWLAAAHLRGPEHAPGFCLNGERFDALASEAPSTF